MGQNLLERYNEMNEFGKDHQLTYTVIEPGHIVYQFTPQKRHLATTHAVHGGMVAAFMDAVIGVAALSAVYDEGKLVATIEFKINFLAPAGINSPLKGIGKVIQKGNSILVTAGEIFDNQGKLIASAQGTLKSYLVKE